MQPTDFSDEQIQGAIAASRAQGYSDADITSGALANFGVDVSQYLNPSVVTSTLPVASSVTPAASVAPTTSTTTAGAATPATIKTFMGATAGTAADEGTPGALRVITNVGDVLNQGENPSTFEWVNPITQTESKIPSWAANAKSWLGTDLVPNYDNAVTYYNPDGSIAYQVLGDPTSYYFDNGNSQYVSIAGDLGPDGKPVVLSTQTRQNFANTGLPMLLQFAAIVGGPLGTIAQVYGAGKAIDSGNIIGGLASLAGVGGYTDVATGLNVAQAVSTGNAGALVTALVNNPTVAAAAGSTMLTDTISLADAANAARVAAAASSGNIAGVLSGASALTGSADLATAAAAANLIVAAKSGNISNILSATAGLQGALAAADRVTDANVASTLVQNTADFAAAAQDTSTTITNPNSVTSGGTDSGYAAYQAAIAAGATPDEALATSNVVTGDTSTVVSNAATDTQVQNAIIASREVFVGDDYNTKQDAANAARLAGATSFSYDGKTYGVDTFNAANQTAINNVLDSAKQDQLASIATIPKFADAYSAARALLGPGQTFTWGGKSYSTATRAEDPALAAASDQARVDNLTLSSTAGGGRGSTTWTSADTLGAVAAATNLNKVSAAAVDWANAGDMFGGESTDAMGNTVNAAGSGANTGLSRTVTAAQDALGKAVQTGLSNLAMAGGEQTAAIGGVLANLKLANADNMLVQAGNAVSNFGSSIETQESKLGTQNIVTAVKNADGMFGKLIAGIQAGWDNPAAAVNLITREGLQEILPIGVASKAAKIMSIGAAAGIDTAMNAGEAMGGAYNDAYKAAIKAGMTPENADAMAAKIGLSAGGIALVTSGVMDAALVKTLFRTETGSIASQLAKGSTKEGVSENIEETITALATQYLTTGKMDFNSALTQGAIGHLIGKTTSGSVGSIDTGVQIGDANAAATGSTAATGDTTSTAATGNAATAGTGSTTTTAGSEISAEAIGGAGKVEDDSDTATIDDFSTVLASTGDANTAATTAVTNAVTSGASTDSAVTSVITAAANTGADTAAATGAAVTAAVDTAASTAATTGVNASTAVTAATNSAVTAAVDTAASTAATTGANTSSAVTSATDAAVTSAVTAAANTGADVNTAATTAVTAAVTAAVNSGADVNTAATTAVTAAVNSGADVNTATTAATDAATTTSTNATTSTNINTAVDTNTNTGTNTNTNTAVDANTGVTTNTTVDANTAVDSNTGVTTNTAVDSNTGVTTNTAVDSNTGVTTTTSTNPNTDVTTTTTTNPNTAVTTNTTTDTNTNTTTNTVTNTDTNSTITLTLNTQTGVPTVTNSTGNVQVIDNNTVVIDGTPIDITTGEVLTEEQVLERKVGVKPKATSPKVAAPKTPAKKTSGALQGYGGNEPSYPYKDHDIQETWLGGIHPAKDPTSALAALFAGNAMMNPDMQAYSALRDATSADSATPASTADYYSYGTEPTPSSVLQPYMRGGTVQNRAEGGKMMASPLMAAAGGEPDHKGSHYVQGAGGGQDDLIPAKLADGEYVFDAEIVAALGDGSNKEGAAKLDKWREAIRKHKRGGSLNSIPPKAKSPLAYMKGI